jgi:hypothetical protein
METTPITEIHTELTANLGAEALIGIELSPEAISELQPADRLAHAMAAMAHAEAGNPIDVTTLNPRVVGVDTITYIRQLQRGRALYF